MRNLDATARHHLRTLGPRQLDPLRGLAAAQQCKPRGRSPVLGWVLTYEVIDWMASASRPSRQSVSHRLIRMRDRGLVESAPEKFGGRAKLTGWRLTELGARVVELADEEAGRG